MPDPITIISLTALCVGAVSSVSSLCLSWYNRKSVVRNEVRASNVEAKRKEDDDALETVVCPNSRYPKPYFRTLAQVLHLSRRHARKTTFSNMEIRDPYAAASEPVCLRVVLSTQFVGVLLKGGRRFQCRYSEQGAFVCRFTSTTDQLLFYDMISDVDQAALDKMVWDDYQVSQRATSVKP